MASEPVRPSRKVRMPFKVSQKLRSLEKRENIPLQCKNSAGKGNSSSRETSNSKGLPELKLSETTPTRPRRSRTIKSALELLGKSQRKDVPKKQAVAPVTPGCKRLKAADETPKQCEVEKSKSHENPLKEKRGRGRPRKFRIQCDDPVKKTTLVTVPDTSDKEEKVNNVEKVASSNKVTAHLSESDISPDQVVTEHKRGRGRPRKYSKNVECAYIAPSNYTKSQESERQTESFTEKDANNRTTKDKQNRDETERESTSKNAEKSGITTSPAKSCDDENATETASDDNQVTSEENDLSNVVMVIEDYNITDFASKVSGVSDSPATAEPKVSPNTPIIIKRGQKILAKSPSATTIQSSDKSTFMINGQNLVETTVEAVGADNVDTKEILPSNGRADPDRESLIACEALSELAEGKYGQVQESLEKEPNAEEKDNVTDEVGGSSSKTDKTVVYIQPASGAPKPAVITWNVQSTQTEPVLTEQSGAQDMEQYQVEVLKPQLTPGVRSKPRKHLVVSQRLQTMIDNLEPADDIQNHIKLRSKSSKEGKRSLMTCKHCDKILRDKHDFRRHIKTHPDVEYKPWKCPVCPYKAQIRASIARHINIHGDIKPYVCEECGKGFNFKQKLMLHMKYHLDIRDCQCEFCGMAFHEYKTLKTHLLKIHHVKVAPRRQGLSGPPMYLTKNEDSDMVDENSDASKDGLTPVLKVDKKTIQRQSKLAQGVHNKSTAGKEASHEEKALIWHVGSGGDLSSLVKALEAGQIPEGATVQTTSTDSLHGQQVMEVHMVEWADDQQNEETDQDKEKNNTKGGDSEERIDDNKDDERKAEDPKVNPDKESLSESINIEDGEVVTLEMVKDGTFMVTASNVIVQHKQDTDQVAQKEITSESFAMSKEKVKELPSQEDCQQSEIEKMKSRQIERPLFRKTRKPQNICMEKKSRLFGTRKTALYTQQFKLGMLSQPKTISTAPTLDLQYREIPGLAPNKKVRRTKILRQEDLDEHLQPYVEVTPIYNQEDLAKVKEKVNEADENEVGGEDKMSEVEYTRVVFYCKLCNNKVFTSKTAAIHHLEKEHQDVKAWTCDQCDYQCRMRTSMIVHRKLHTGIKDYSCHLCGKAFAFKQKLRNHMKYHLNLREYKCSQCDRAFNERNDLTKHIRRVHVANRTEVCDTCDKAFKDPVQLRRHKQNHLPSNGHLCQYCNKFYRSKMSLAQHMKSHTCMFHCEICAKNFGSYSGFMAHKVMHDESYGGYECEICQKVLHTKGSLTRHTSVVHSTDRHFKCDTCNRRFKTKKDLKNHGIVHVSLKQFVCEVCQFSCKRAESLRVHMRRHSTVKPFLCGVCGKEYTQRSALETHIQHHTGDLSAKCNLCGREFLTKYQLVLHMKRKHMAGEQTTEDKDTVLFPTRELLPTEEVEKAMTVYMCQECNSVFLSQDNLAVHILSEHMRHNWNSETEVQGDGESENAACGSTVTTNVTVTSATSMIDTQPLEGTTIEIPSIEGEQEVQNSTYNGGDTMETLVTVSNPSSQSKSRLVSLILPAGSTSQQEVEQPTVITITSQASQVSPQTELLGSSQTDSISEAETSIASEMLVTENQAVTDVESVHGQTLTTWLDADGNQETYVSVTDPSTIQQMLVAVQPTNLETLLQSSDGEATTVNGTPLMESAYVTVETPVGQITGDETYVTIPEGDFTDGQGLIAVPMEQGSETIETIEIPIGMDSEIVTIQENEG